MNVLYLAWPVSEVMKGVKLMLNHLRHIYTASKECLVAKYLLSIPALYTRDLVLKCTALNAHSVTSMPKKCQTELKKNWTKPQNHSLKYSQQSFACSSFSTLGHHGYS